MSNLSLIMLSGHLGKDATVNVTPAGQAILKFRMAVNVPHRKADNSYEDQTMWVNVSRFFTKKESADKLAGALGKGSKVSIEGRLSFDPATGSPKIWAGQDGAARASYEVIASNLEIHNSKPVGGAAPVEAPADAGEEVPEGEVNF